MSTLVQTNTAVDLPHENIAAHQNLGGVEVVTAARQKGLFQQTSHCRPEAKFTFQLTNDLSQIYPLIEVIQCLVRNCYGRLDEMYEFGLAISWEESLTNAMIHGNLEISSVWRNDSDDTYYRLIEERQNTQPYSDRRVGVVVTLDPEQVSFVVSDQGAGFDVSRVPDPTAEENLEKPCGRGLMLMRRFMDSVYHNDVGNQVTMIKHKPMIE